MLIEKRKRFEEVLKIPEQKRLKGTGWLQSFKSRCALCFLTAFLNLQPLSYSLKECRCHGEAGSVDLKAVIAERQCMRRITAQFPPEDCFNANETSFFPSAPPDRTLCSAAMSGQKKDKFRISVLALCEGTGSEKHPLMFIGKYKSPRAFNKKNPARMRPSIYYRNNKKAWMTSVLYNEYVPSFLLGSNADLTSQVHLQARLRHGPSEAKNPSHS